VARSSIRLVLAGLWLCSLALVKEASLQTYVQFTAPSKRRVRPLSEATTARIQALLDFSGPAGLAWNR